ncbi:MAG: hypothetical protein EOO42_04100 [Flavobacteriales bacterium]|nr:MAG: hypothetical protein EOO42_04100 [Flavobacteriales bacterium]
MNTIPLQWSYFEKLIFRFAFAVLFLFMFFFNNGTLPMFYFIGQAQNALMHKFVPWLGEHVFHLSYPITEFTNGSGDTTYDYVVLSCVAVLSLAITLVWTLLDSKRENYNRLYYWITVAVRFYVGLMLINYGLVKVVQLQFPAPGLYRLISTYGESSPMGLAWTFLGFSKGYNLFMGIAELMAGLLLFRRTVTVGAIITLMTAANVMAVNYFFDVPVKIVSTALVVICLFLLVPNIKRLFNLFFRGEAIVLRTLDAPLIAKRWLRITKHTIKYVLIGFIVLGGIANVINSYGKYGAGAPKSPLYGAYKVDEFSTTAKNNAKRWDLLVLETPEYGGIKDADGFEWVKIKADTVKKKLTFAFTNDPDTKQELGYKKDGDKLYLFGRLYQDSVFITLEKMKFELTDRKLNWINERPYNK